MAELISNISFRVKKTQRKSKKSQGYVQDCVHIFSKGTTDPINHRASLKSTEATVKEAFVLTLSDFQIC